MGLIKYYIKCTIRKMRYPIIQRKYHLAFDRNVDVDENCIFEGYNYIGKNCILRSVTMGKLSYLGFNCHLEKCKIGRFCSIGPGVQIAAGNHPTSTFVSTHPTLFSNRKYCGLGYCDKKLFSELSYTNKNKHWYVEIGNDVWIGQNVTILNGCTIGDGAIVAAGAVVTRNVEDYTLVAGVPAKPINKRFSQRDISFLKELRWWDKDDSWIKANSQYFVNIDNLRKKVRG